MKHGISLWKNVSEIKPRLGVCQFQQKMSIKNYAVLLSKVMTFLLEPVRGFISKQHVTFFFPPADFWVRCVVLWSSDQGEREGSHLKLCGNFCRKGAFLPSLCGSVCMQVQHLTPRIRAISNE